MRIATELLRAIEAEASASRAREVCGLLFGEAGLIAGRTPARNVAPNPASAFEIDPAVLLAAHRAQRQGGPAIFGCYHSHPSGRPEPSLRDAADAEPNGWLWLIVGSGAARLWRATLHGSVRGRFDPVPFTCVSVSDGPHGPLPFPRPGP